MELILKIMLLYISKYFKSYPVLILLIWFVVYVLSQILFAQKLGWDEVDYLSVARGISEDFDFSSRTYTIMGILKHGYPTHFINIPLYSVFIAVFFKLFGTSLKVAYFLSWLSCLGICLLLYFIFLLLSDGNRKLSFFVSMSYLFCPGILRNCDSAMMEQTGIFLLCLFLFLILRDFKKGTIGFLTTLKVAIGFLILWIYKSLFIGIFFGTFAFILFAFSTKLNSYKLNSKLPLFAFLLLSYGIFAILYILLKKFVFLPVAPMMNFTQDLEAKQLYADFLAGFFQNFPESFIRNIQSFFTITLGQYFIYPSPYTNPNSQFFVFLPFVVFIGIYFLLFFISIILLFASWKKLSPTQKLFSIFTITSIISFNLIFNVFFSTTYENVMRYNMYYLPLYLCFVILIFSVNHEYRKPFIQEHPRVSKSIFTLLFLFVYVPVFLSVMNLQQIFWDRYHTRAKLNDEIIKSVIKDEKPMFIYFNDGIHTSFTHYPIRRVMKDATNEQFLKVNEILPEPIKYVFLKPSDWLFQINQQKILMSEPILNDMYKLEGFNNVYQIVVYKYNGKEIKDGSL